MACEIFKIALPIHHLIHCGLQKSDSEEGGHRQAAEPQGQCFHAWLSPVQARTPVLTSCVKRSITRCISATSAVMMSNTMWLTPQSAQHPRSSWIAAGL